MIATKAKQLQKILEENGKLYSLEQIEKALEHWLEIASETILQDAEDWIWGGLSRCRSMGR
ncbi:hypothetical protein [Kamptonema sp. UHCC 0994]|uniref:hypothetical protein n=1 Tax=Kamptonema sp. UHCC 0994 TaxID=3031329 RepID=UPI0023B9A50F|nr:hypothetical protein [Kamptonema sp. UHCC 0994]MDF0553129.1 hypothetical protein [Kamptonema sp. UHCC 0994]